MKTLRENERERTKEKDKENSSTAPARARERMKQLFDSLPDSLGFYPALWTHGILTRDVFDAALNIGMSPEEVIGWLKYMQEVGYVFKDGTPISLNTFRRSLRMWHKTEERLVANSPRRSMAEERRANEERLKELKRKSVENEAKRIESWELCIERCARFTEGKCKCGVKIPPALWNPPRPPEECSRFARIGGES